MSRIGEYDTVFYCIVLYHNEILVQEDVLRRKGACGSPTPRTVSGSNIETLLPGIRYFGYVKQMYCIELWSYTLVTGPQAGRQSPAAAHPWP